MNVLGKFEDSSLGYKLVSGLSFVWLAPLGKHFSTFINTIFLFIMALVRRLIPITNSSGPSNIYIKWVSFGEEN